MGNYIFFQEDTRLGGSFFNTGNTGSRLSYIMNENIVCRSIHKYCKLRMTWF